MHLGWIGTGNMGVRMARRLLEAGNSLQVYNRTLEKAMPLVKNNKAELAGSVAGLAKRSDLIFLSVTNGDAEQEVLDGDHGVFRSAKPGLVLVDLSTISPKDSVALHSEASKYGIRYLDAPVIGSMYMVEKGLLRIIVSGDQKAYQLAQPYLVQIGKDSTYLGEKSQARYLKLAVNMLICTYLTIYSEVLLVGEAMGLPWEILNQGLEQSAGASPMLQDKGTTLKDRIWESTTALTSTAAKDLGLALEYAREQNLPMPVTAMAAQYDNLMLHSSKYGRYSSFGTIGLLEELCGTTEQPVESISREQSDQALQILEQVLVAVTSLVTEEAVKFALKAGVPQPALQHFILSCHGATTYLRPSDHPKHYSFPVGELRSALNEALSIARDKGLFVPILTTADQVWTQRKEYVEDDQEPAQMLSFSLLKATLQKMIP